MSANGAGSTAASAPRPPQRERSWLPALLPAITFLIGVALGGALIAVGTNAGGDDSAAPHSTAAPAPSGSASTSGDAVVTVPGACLDAANQAEEAFSLLRGGVTAIRDLDARRLQELVDQLQKLDPQVRSLVDECRAAAAVSTPS